MKRYLVLVTAVAFAGAVLNAACTEQQLQEFRTFAGVNGWRQEHNLPALDWDSRLAAAARLRAQDLVDYGYFGHVNPVNGSDFWTAMRDVGIEPTAWPFSGENLAWTEAGYQAAPGEVVAAWTESPTHNAVMLDPHYQRGAVGYAEDAGGRKFYALLVEGWGSAMK